MIEYILLYGTYRLVKAMLADRALAVPPTTSSLASTPAPAQVVTFVGRTGAGKSSTLNALLEYAAFPVGVEHGTTTTIAECDYYGGYKLRDTPGLLDTVDYCPLLWDAVKSSALVIYTSTGQLYRRELEFVEELSTRQHLWDAESETPGSRQLALFINHQDVREATKPTRVRAQEDAAIREQVAPWIPPGRVLFGAAAPVNNGSPHQPRISTLKRLIHNHIDNNSASERENR